MITMIMGTLTETNIQAQTDMGMEMGMGMKIVIHMFITSKVTPMDTFIMITALTHTINPVPLMSTAPKNIMT